MLHSEMHPGRDEPPRLDSRGVSDIEQAYKNMLTRLCTLTHVPAADQPIVLDKQTLVLGEVAITFRLEEWSSFVKIYIEVGKPAPASAPDLYRYLLSQHLTMPAPFSLIAALHPETEAVVLYGYSPLPMDSQSDESFLAFLYGCVYTCEVLRNNAPYPMEAPQA